MSHTASDRSALIRLASTLPAGSAERRAILANLASRVAGSTPHYPQFDASLRDGRLSMRSWPPTGSDFGDRAFAESFKQEAIRQFNAVIKPRLEGAGFTVAGPPRLNAASYEVTFPVNNADTKALLAEINSELSRI